MVCANVQESSVASLTVHGLKDYGMVVRNRSKNYMFALGLILVIIIVVAIVLGVLYYNRKNMDF